MATYCVGKAACIIADAPDSVSDGQSHGHGMDGLAAGGRRGLARLYHETRRALAGEAVDEPAFRALQRVVRRHEIPERYPLELLEGFAMDVDGRTYVELEGGHKVGRFCAASKACGTPPSR
jgi:phytoene/squalene synthetase